jgi:hypothetical protein
VTVLPHSAVSSDDLTVDLHIGSLQRIDPPERKPAAGAALRGRPINV